MVKLILLARRAPGTDRADFRHYYETKHASLAGALMSRCVRYVRNFVAEEPTGPLDFDVVTEFWFDIEGPWEEMRQHLVDAASADILADDEARFMDRSSMRIFTVHEHESDPALLPANARLASGSGESFGRHR